MKKLISACLVMLAVSVPVMGAELTPTELDKDAITFSLTAADTVSSDTFVNTDRTFLIIRNDNDTAADITIPVQKTSFRSRGFGTITFDDLTFSVAGGDSIVAIPTATYNDGGRVQVDYAGDSTALTVGVFKVEQQ